MTGDQSYEIASYAGTEDRQLAEQLRDAEQMRMASRGTESRNTAALLAQAAVRLTALADLLDPPTHVSDYMVTIKVRVRINHDNKFVRDIHDGGGPELAQDILEEHLSETVRRDDGENGYNEIGVKVFEDFETTVKEVPGEDDE